MSKINSNIYLNFFPTLVLNWDEKTKLLHIKNIQESFSKRTDLLFFIDSNGLKLDFFDKLEAELDNLLTFNNSYLDEKHDSFVLEYLTNDRDLNNFLDRLDNNSVEKTVSIDKIQSFSTSILPKDSAKLLFTKTSQIKSRLNELKSENAPTGKTLLKIEQAEFFLETALNFKPNFSKEGSEDGFEFPATFFNEIYRLLLYSEVDLNYADHMNIDPVTGWINPPHDIISFSGFNISNPFVSFQFGEKQNGVLINFDYFPKKESVSGFHNSLFFSSKEDVSNYDSLGSNPIPPTLMRKSPDLYGIKFVESLNVETSVFPINKIFYLRSGLTPAGNYSTTGFELEFWIDESMKISDNYLDKLLYLHFIHSFNCESEFANFRHLTDVGGVSSEVHSTKSNVIRLSNSELAGQLKGLRTIDSINQFVSDYRFSCSAEKISITPSPSKIKNRANFGISFCFKIRSFYGYENLQKFVFTIY